MGFDYLTHVGSRLLWGIAIMTVGFEQRSWDEPPYVPEHLGVDQASVGTCGHQDLLATEGSLWRRSPGV